MGFYAPAQLVRDARAHGVEVRPVDACVSLWDSTLERGAQGAPALRLGLRLVKSLSEAGAARLSSARAAQPLASVADLALRGALDRGDLRSPRRRRRIRRLKRQPASGLLGGGRHRARAAAGAYRRRRGAAARGRPAAPECPERGAGHRRRLCGRSGSRSGRHPLALLRERLHAWALSERRELKNAHHGARVRTAGIVLMRQRPATASGVTFLTLEDESGQVNVIVWERVGARAARSAARVAPAGSARASCSSRRAVTHLIAHRLIDRTGLLGELLTRSRDF